MFSPLLHTLKFMQLTRGGIKIADGASNPSLLVEAQIPLNAGGTAVRVQIDGTAPGGATGASAITTGATKSIAIAGTPVRIAAAAATRGVILSANPNNTSTIYVGGSSIGNGSSGNTGYMITPGGSYFFPMTDASILYINGDTNGDSVGVTII